MLPPKNPTPLSDFSFASVEKNPGYGPDNSSEPVFKTIYFTCRFRILSFMVDLVQIVWITAEMNLLKTWSGKSKNRTSSPLYVTTC